MFPIKTRGYNVLFIGNSLKLRVLGGLNKFTLRSLFFMQRSKTHICSPIITSNRWRNGPTFVRYDTKQTSCPINPCSDECAATHNKALCSTQCSIWILINIFLNIHQNCETCDRTEGTLGFWPLRGPVFLDCEYL